MTKKKTLQDYSMDEMRAEIDRRWAVAHYQPGMTMSLLELAKCGKRVPVKAKDRDRTLRTMAGTVTLKRNYHYCEHCKLGFYPLDRALDLPEEGELTHEMEKRVADFAVNDVYGQGADRWNLHYREPISDNLLRRVAARLGGQCESADQGHLQEALKPSTEVADALVVQMDGSLLPIRGAEPWKEAKVGVTYRHDTERNRSLRGSERYCAVVGTVANFRPPAVPTASRRHAATEAVAGASARSRRASALSGPAGPG